MSTRLFEYQVDFYTALGWSRCGETLRATVCKKAWEQFRHTIDLFLWIWLYNDDDTAAEVELDFPTIKVEIWQREKAHAEQL